MTSYHFLASDGPGGAHRTPDDQVEFARGLGALHLRAVRAWNRRNGRDSVELWLPYFARLVNSVFPIYVVLFGAVDTDLQGNFMEPGTLRIDLFS